MVHVASARWKPKTLRRHARRRRFRPHRRGAGRTLHNCAATGAAALLGTVEPSPTLVDPTPISSTTPHVWLKVPQTWSNPPPETIPDSADGFQRSWPKTGRAHSRFLIRPRVGRAAPESGPPHPRFVKIGPTCGRTWTPLGRTRSHIGPEMGRTHPQSVAAHPKLCRTRPNRAELAPTWVEGMIFSGSGGNKRRGIGETRRHVRVVCPLALGQGGGG